VARLQEVNGSRLGLQLRFPWVVVVHVLFVGNLYARTRPPLADAYFPNLSFFQQRKEIWSSRGVTSDLKVILNFDPKDTFPCIIRDFKLPPIFGSSIGGAR
jgi:hypothetical protein